MSEPIHPIRKMRQDYEATLTYESGERALARHVKPLLDALEKCCYSHNVRGDDGPCECPQCRLLAAWRAKP